jgi:TetR/AcrR family transcriptional repressor of nem operon
MPAMDTREAIMATARAMVQYRGYNALSFRELGKAVGIKSASIHHHFPTKGDLAAALARRYTDDAAALLDVVLAGSTDPQACIHQYTDIFRAALLRDNRMCLCGILAAEHVDLPAPVRIELERFAQVNIAWLVRVLALGKVKAVAALEPQALAIFAAVEGAQLVARSRGGDIAAFDQVIAAYRKAGLLP